MFPLRDSHPSRRFPVINYLLILFTCLVFFIQLIPPDFKEFVYQYGFVPANFNFFNFESYKNIFYSIFLHGGLFHLFSNMWFLHIFGDNVEDRLGHLRYLFFYLAGGVAAVFSQYIFNTDSIIPMIGASGAVSAVAGLYFASFKRARIEALVVGFFGLWHKIELPAWFFLGYWFLTQIYSGLGALATFNSSSGGIAWFAHIGGFVFGYIVAKLI